MPVVLSRRVASAQSNFTVSGQVSWYQSDSCVAPAGGVNVCEMELSPPVGVVSPSCAAKLPECPPGTTAVAAPAEDQPVRSPVSKPPFWMGGGGGGGGPKVTSS